MDDRAVPELDADGKAALRGSVVAAVRAGREVPLDAMAYTLSRILTDAELASCDQWPIASVVREVFPGVVGETLATSMRAQLAIVERARRKRRERARKRGST